MPNAANVHPRSAPRQCMHSDHPACRGCGVGVRWGGAWVPKLVEKRVLSGVGFWRSSRSTGAVQGLKLTWQAPVPVEHQV